MQKLKKIHGADFSNRNQLGPPLIVDLLSRSEKLKTENMSQRIRFSAGVPF